MLKIVCKINTKHKLDPGGAEGDSALFLFKVLNAVQNFYGIKNFLRSSGKVGQS